MKIHADIPGQQKQSSWQAEPPQPAVPSNPNRPVGPRPVQKSTLDFERLIRQLQRQQQAECPVHVLDRPILDSRWEGAALVFCQGANDYYAVVLARILGLSRMPPARPQNGQVTPFSAQVLAGMCRCPVAILYLLFGQSHNLRLYVGCKARAATSQEAVAAAASAFESLCTCLTASYADVRLTRLETEEDYHQVVHRLSGLNAAVSLTGNPCPDLTGDLSRSHADRLVEALAGSSYCYAVEGSPIEDTCLMGMFRSTAAEIARTHDFVKWTASGSLTSTQQESRERIDHNARQYEELLEIKSAKLEAGLREGMWQAAVILLATNASEIKRAGALLRSTCAGKLSQPEPIQLVTSAGAQAARGLCQFQWPIGEGTAPGAMSGGANPLQTELCSSDLGLLIELPRKEAPGFRITRAREFGLDVAASTQSGCVPLGSVLSRAGVTNTRFEIDLDDLTRHALIVGVTGSGKTNTAMHMLDQVWARHHVPFLVIEPAKAQYRNLLSTGRYEGLQVFAPGYKTVAPFRMNPFEFPPGLDPQAHITNLYTVFNAAFILYAPMPYVLERALYEVYEDSGWDLGLGRHPDADASTGRAPFLAFPTLTDLYHKIQQVVDRLGYDERIRMDVTAGLQARVDSLRVGQKGQTFDCRQSVPFQALLERPTILELSHLGSDDEKAFLIGLLLMRLYEHLELAGESPQLRHLTLVEEAHRLLTRTSTDTSSAEVANVKGKAVESFCNILAEIRAYGEGLIIAEQIPTKLADDVLKNTNLKVMHRLVAADDRELMGGTMNITGQQTMVVTALRRGEAVAYAEGVENPVLVQVPRFATPHAVTDAEVAKASRAFYGRYPGVFRQVPGCEHCTEVCHYGPVAKRLADHRAARTLLWSFALTVLRSPGAAGKAWQVFQERLLASPGAPVVRPADRAGFVWCASQLAAERIFLTLRTRGIPLADLASVLSGFAGLCQALRQPGDDLAVRVSQYRAKAGKVLQLKGIPLDGCGRCPARCVFGPLGAELASEKRRREGLSAAFKEKNAPAAVRQFCQITAEEVLLGASADAVRDLALCFYIQVAFRVGARRVESAATRIFGAAASETARSP